MSEATELQAAGELESALGTVSGEVEIKGKTITVAPLVARQLSDVLRRVYALKKLGMIEVEVVKTAGDETDVAETVRETAKRLDYVKMFMTGGDEVLDILRIAASQRKEVVDTLNLVELLSLAKKVVEINVDFFLRNLPAIQEMFGVLKEAKAGLVEGLGDAPSPGSSTTDTE